MACGPAAGPTPLVNLRILVVLAWVLVFRVSFPAVMLGWFVAIPLGWALGYGLGYLLVGAMASETYRIPLVVSTQTYFWTGLITAVAAYASAMLVRRRLNRMDLIAVLKTRE